MAVDGNGLPVRPGRTGGQAHDNRLCSTLLGSLPRGGRLPADRGYDADWIREMVSLRGAWANIPPKRNRKDPICFSPCLYRDRNLVERFFSKVKHCRRNATRYDKLAANYLAFVKLACIRPWLRSYESTAWPDPSLPPSAGALLAALRSPRNCGATGTGRAGMRLPSSFSRT